MGWNRRTSVWFSGSKQGVLCGREALRWGLYVCWTEQRNQCGQERGIDKKIFEQIE